ncbi:TPA: Ig-like domain-containing protein, partial [Enterococcus faecium]
MPDTFKIYKKDGTKVTEGESPLTITGIAANTQV